VRGIPDAPPLTPLESLAAAGALPEFLQRPVFRSRIRAQLARLRKTRPQLLQQGSLALEAAIAEPEETPAAFFSLFLGMRMKYSCGLWSSAKTLDEADEAMLALVCERAGITDGMAILDLGAGWGALSSYLAERFPHARILALTRSRAQADFIRTRSPNVTVLHADMRTVALDQRFDRVLAIEAIEHVRNPAALLARIEGWLAPGGQLFVQAIAHRELAYPLPSGVMLADDTLPQLAHCTAQWSVDGGHYVRTVAAWRARLKAAQRDAAAVLGGPVRRWRAFFLACEELFGWDRGRQWRVVHQRFDRAALAGVPPKALTLPGP
jgi:cyclopropane-fatty-acyl-phospholipid synthase